MISIPIWLFVLFIVLAVAGIGLIVWFIISFIIYVRDYRELL